ncbi:MAG: DNA-protecting protein DprA [Flavobacteriales bacterium]|nr:DNA-protecting protein DprA [Flavobacteriales bacterium]
MDPRTNDQVVLLLTAHLPGASGAQPLSAGEWSRLSNWLRERGHAPGDLLVGDPARTLHDWSDKTATPVRIAALLERGFQLGLLTDKWQRAGLWVVTRASPDYPALLLQRLGDQAPPLFHGAGDRKKLDTKALAVIGSRNADEEDLLFARRMGHAAASQGWSIVSGGARGVDEASMRGAIDANGTVIGVLADSLLKTATSLKYRDAILRGDIVLISPYHPESGFSGANAMARNKYVYCLGRAAVVVRCDKDKGGTWAGATEDLKKKWIPLWVKHDPDMRSGNHALIERGGLPLPDADVQALVMEELAQGSTTRSDLFAISTVREPAAPFGRATTTGEQANGQETSATSEAAEMDAVLKALHKKPMTSEALARHLKMADDRVAQLLGRLVHLHRVVRPTGRKRSYKPSNPGQTSMPFC